MRYLILIGLVLLSGCQSLGDASKWLIPINASIAYFGAVGVHEGGHAATAYGLGSDEIDVKMLPGKDEAGDFHFALTTAESTDWSPSDITLFHTMGPTANFAGHVGLRELLKSEIVPRPLQPTLAWLSFGNQVAFYFHAGAGLARIDSTDLGKEEFWISAVVLLGGLTYDIYDIGTDGWKNFAVMFGEDFYTAREPDRARIKPISAPLPGGGYFGLRIEW